MKEVEKKETPEVSGGMVGDVGEVIVLPYPIPQAEPLPVPEANIPTPGKWQEV